LLTHSPPGSKPVTLLVPLSLSFKSKFKDWTSPAVAMNDGPNGLIQQ
jgi:hypothetical protein